MGMKVVQFSEFGGPEKLQVVELPQPTVGRGEVLVRVKAAGLNPGESMIRQGLFEDFFPTKLPCGEGSDFAGIVQELGQGVTDFKMGDEVVGYTDHRASHAEFVVADVDKLKLKPKSVSWEVGGSLFVAGNTAIASVEAVSMKSSDTLVVAGAAGGVGAIASQLAVIRGAHVIGIASENYHGWLHAHGVIPVDYHGDTAAQIRRLVDVVNAFIDTVGDGYVDLALELGVSPERINTTIDFQAVHRYHVQSKGSTDANGKQSLDTLLRHIDEGELEIPIARTFSIDQIREAYVYMEGKHKLGKTVIRF
jgi:NADPH:quinone reductase-like Zn-dependent oxidoreductase